MMAPATPLSPPLPAVSSEVRLPDWLDPRVEDGRLRLHIGGSVPRPGWKILNIQAGPDVDYVGDCTDLSRFPNGSVSAVYASHVLEHLSHKKSLASALAEIRRVIVPNGLLLMSVPDLEVLCELFLDRSLSLQERHHVMMMMFGAQMDEHDYHKVGLWRDYLAYLLRNAGFRRVDQVPMFGLFHDSSLVSVRGRLISLNLIVT